MLVTFHMQVDPCLSDNSNILHTSLVKNKYKQNHQNSHVNFTVVSWNRQKRISNTSLPILVWIDFSVSYFDKDKLGRL